MLIAYFDESGSKDTPFLTMAGYLSSEHKWKRFEREWAKTLKEYGAKYLPEKLESTANARFDLFLYRWRLCAKQIC